MNISEIHVPDCPQFWSLLSPLSAHQLPEINIYILLSTFLTYIKQFFTTPHSIIYIASHSLLLQEVPSLPPPPFLLSLQVLLYPPFLLLNPVLRVMVKT